MINIIPAIMSDSLEEFKKELEKVWSKVSRVQVDVIDGKFAERETIKPEELNMIDTVVAFDVHLMVSKPEEWVSRCAMGGVDRVFGQVENMEDVVAFVGDVQAEGMAVGLAYDVDTPIDGLEEVIDNLDAVLLLSVKAGKQGQEFDEKVLKKIKEVRKLSKKVTLVIDGGLNEKEIKKCLVAAWAEEMEEGTWERNSSLMDFAVGSELLNAKDVEKRLGELQRLEGGE